MMNRPPEVLAPAGSYEIMLRAFRAGADAVYLGGQMYGARAYAANLSDQELLQAIQYAAFHHKKVYLTVNTLLKDEEIDRLLAYLKGPYEMGLHGVIVQDLGAVTLIRSRFPDLMIHASTQMTITSPASALQLKEIGVTRVVPARELTIKEIRQIKDESGLEVEVFVHGALCYSYSGQCLLSSMIGGRSGNRGTCAQPCRQLYGLYDADDLSSQYRLGTYDGTDQRYYLSPKDLCGLTRIPELVEAGVDSLKIEGRMKNAEYVISATEAYRRAVDACVNSVEYHSQEEINRLADIFNRGGFTEGYFHQMHGRSMMCMDRNHHNGILIGKIRKVHGGTLDLLLEQNLDSGDILEIRLGHTSFVELTSGITGHAGEIVSIHGKQMKRLSPGMEVYRTKHPSLCKELLDHNDHNQLKEKIHISVICKKDLPVTIKMCCDEQQITVTGSIAQPAENRCVTREELLEKLNKTGEYPFVIESIEWNLDPDVFVSMKEWNQLRRRAMDELQQACELRECRVLDRQEAGIDIAPGIDPVGIRTRLEEPKTTGDIQNGFAVYISRPDQLDAVLVSDQIHTIGMEMEDLSTDQIRQMIDKIRNARMGCQPKIKIMIALPHIYRESMKDAINKYLDLAPDGCLVRTLDELCLIDSRNRLCDKKYSIVLDSSVYAYNRKTVSYYMEQYGISGLTLPVEYDQKDLARLMDRTGSAPWQWVVYGQQMVMVTAQCTYLNRQSCRKEDTKTDERTQGNSWILVNQHKDEFVVEPVCKYCYNVIYQKKPVCLLDVRSRFSGGHLCEPRIHFRRETPMEIHRILGNQLPADYVRGNYTRGI